MPKGGARPGAGNPGYGKQIAVREGVERLTPRWFAMIEEMLDAPAGRGSENLELWRIFHEDRRFALAELGKLMGKLMPVEITGKDGKDLFPTPLLANLDVSHHNSNTKNSDTEQTDTGDTGRDFGLKDNLDNLIPD